MIGGNANGYGRLLKVFAVCLGTTGSQNYGVASRILDVQGNIGNEFYGRRLDVGFDELMFRASANCSPHLDWEFDWAAHCNPGTAAQASLAAVAGATLTAVYTTDTATFGAPFLDPGPTGANRTNRSDRSDGAVHRPHRADRLDWCHGCDRADRRGRHWGDRPNRDY